EGAGEDAHPDGVLRVPGAVRRRAGAGHHQHPQGLQLSERATGTLTPPPAAHPDRRRWPPTVATAIGAVLVAGAFVIGLRPIVDNSFLTHLATGRVILESGVPTTDPFGSTSSSLGSPWVVQSWLPATAYALLERLGGGPGADGGLQLVRLLT